MSDTPRTDAVEIAWDFSPEPKVMLEHAQQLERELNSANTQIGLLISGSKQQERQIEFLKAHIKRLDEAGDHMANVGEKIVHQGGEDMYWIRKLGDELIEWTKAKEAKP